MKRVIFLLLVVIGCAPVGKPVDKPKEKPFCIKKKETRTVPPLKGQKAGEKIYTTWREKCF